MDRSIQTDISWLLDSPIVLRTPSPGQDVQTPLESSTDSMNESDVVTDACKTSSHGDENVDEDSVVDSIAQSGAAKPIQSLTDLLADIDISDDSTTDDEKDMRSDSLSPDDDSPPPYVTLPKTNLPWPAILQYLRETESESSKYFSIERGDPQPASQQGNSEHLCHFCGRVPCKFSLIYEEQNQEPKFCCPDYRDYTILAAAYAKKMLDAKLDQRPGKVFIENRHSQFKKTAQERAYERVRRRRKWEEAKERRAKLLQSSIARQNLIIHFSLTSNTCVNAGWTLHPDDVKKLELQAKKSRKLQISQSIAPLSDDFLAHLPNMQPGQLLTEKYSSGHLSVLILPDRTGQYYYPSGNIAIQIIHIHPQLKAYFLFKDTNIGQPIGYVDELGRGWLVNDNDTLRLVSSLDQCYVIDGLGRVKHWLWKDTATYSLWLPIVFRLNLHLTVRYINQDIVHVSLNACQQQHKLTISRIYKQISNTHDKAVESYKIQLEKLQYQFNCHLSSLERMSKLVKQSHTLPPVVSRHRKSHSTGPIMLHKT